MQRNLVVSVAFGVCLTLGASFSATAAGQSTNPPKPKATQSTQATTGYHWKGLYAGVNTGTITGTFQGPVTIPSVTASGTTVPATTFPFSVSSTAFTGGAQVGYNWQHRRLLFGVESTFNGMNLNGSDTVTAAFAASSANGVLVSGDSFTAHSHWVISLRPRIGYTRNKLLVYVTGGLSFANAYAQANFIQTISGGITFPAASGSDSHTFTGGTIGAGLEYAVLEKWRLGGEYRYTTYGSTNFNFGTIPAIGVGTTPPTFTYAPVTASIGAHTNEFVVKLNRNF